MVESLLSSLRGAPASALAADAHSVPASPQPKRAGLRVALFDAVGPTHAGVSGHVFFKALKDKSLNRAQLARYLTDQEHVIEALESALYTHAAQPAIRPLIDGRVTNRRGLAAADAIALGVDPRPSPTPAACRLAAHIGSLQQGGAYAALSVHAWVQYNAMLNGGQQMAYAMRRLFHETPMAAFQFSPPAAQLRTDYAEAINQVPYHQSELPQLCAEAEAAFLANTRMLDEVMTGREKR